RDLVSLPGVGMSIMEISHRSKVFDRILETAEADLRRLGDVPADYRVLFLQGGASLQFSMVPMNLQVPAPVADYILPREWAERAIEEARKVGRTHVAASTSSDNFRRVPSPAELDLTSGAAYVHMTSNNTIYGTEWHALPDVAAPLVCDASSDMYSRPIDV